ncbi:heterokaryon incompatibility [Hyaloscypha hepaticicola]|uniref:Heterokaryon incompatibility n=1 Tax=Hyaloscypha hepaticicola TaxID=2082293 RepID=A0A2J6QDU4_9HELO|nr:heterokaryon incompatibility [Hyaloscypha hepaticicola]
MCEKVEYITLSYCWGGDVSSKTTKSNLNHRYKSIEWSTLPQTIQDAITITRELGCRYIWIDALCIVQDDSVDWAREATTMSQVYENCILTISATKFETSISGFLQPRTSNFYILWTQIVEDYCRRSLTFSRDKLIAIAGIAERYQAKVKDRYIAGLWDYNLLGWLMWERGRPGSGIHGFGHRFEEYQAPSWSWASFNG